MITLNLKQDMSIVKIKRFIVPKEISLYKDYCIRKRFIKNLILA